MRRKNIRIPVICLAIALASLSLAGCSSTESSKNGKNGQVFKDSAGVSDAKEAAYPDGSNTSADGEEEDTATEEAVRANAEFVVTPSYSEEELSGGYDEAQATAISLSGNSAACDDESVQTEKGIITITKSGTYVLSGTLDDGRIVVETDKADKGIVRLVLNGAQITSKDGSAIYVKKAKETILTLKENTQNTITDAEDYSEENAQEGMKAAIFSKEDLTVNGEGTVQILANYKHGIQSKDNLLFVSGTIGITSADDAVVGKDSVVIKDAVLAIDAQGQGIKGTSNEAEKGYVYVENAQIGIQAAGDGIHAETVVQIDGGTLTVTSQDDGIHADVKLLLNGGDITVEDSYEGLEACMVILNDGDVKLHTSDDGINATNGADSFMGGGLQGDFKDDLQDAPSDRKNDGTNGGAFDAAPDGNADSGRRQRQNDRSDEKQRESSDEKSAESGKRQRDGLEQAQATVTGMTGESMKKQDGQTDTETNNKDRSINSSGNTNGNDRFQQMPNGEMPQMGDGEFPQMPNGEMPEMPDGEMPQMGDGQFPQFSDGKQQNTNTALQVLDAVVEINGGSLYINAGGDGLDSNGNIVMTGGSVIVDGPENNGNGAIDYENTFEMKGGTLVAAGSSGMAMATSAASTVNAVLINLSDTYQNAKVVLKDSKGNEVVSYSPVKKFSSIVFANALLKSGETYTVFADGEEIDSFTVSQTVTTVGSAGNGGFREKN